MIKDLNALVRLEARKEKDLLAFERVQARKVKDLLAYERAKARMRKSPQCIQGGGDVHPGQVEAPDKVFLTSERVQARKSPSRL